MVKGYLIPLEYIPRIDHIADIIKSLVIAVGDNCLAAGFEIAEIVDNFRAEEG